MDKPRPNELLGVQVLCAVTAPMVVDHYAVDQWTTNTPGYAARDYWPNGAAAEDVLLVISGLVMTISVRRNANRPHATGTFAKDRVIRIVPLYWVVTAPKVVTVLAAPGLATRTTLDPLYVAGSYLLLPVHDATGVIRPILPAGRTLTYEMFFYVLVATALLSRIPLGRICIPGLLGCATLTFIVPSDGFANTSAAEFIFGIVIGNVLPRLQSLRPEIGAVVGPVAFVLLATVPVGNGLARPLTWGIPAACIVAAAVSTELSPRRYLPNWLLAAGNASYATYLTHGFVVPASFIVCRSIAVDWAGRTATIIFSLVVSAMVGHVTRHLVEQPLLLRLSTRRPVSTMPAPG